MEVTRIRHPHLARAISFLAVIACLLSPSSGVFAISNFDNKAVTLDTTFYDTTDYTTTDTTCTDTTGSLNTTNAHTPEAAAARERAIWNYLTTRNKYGVAGLAPYQAAGIMGNMQTESANTWNPTVVEGVTYADSPPNYAAGSPDQPPGYGIVQWTPGSKIVSPIKELGGEVNDLGSQLDLLWNQLFAANSPLSEHGAGDALLAATNIHDATVAFETQYERHAGSPQPDRVDQAKAILSKYGDGGSDTGSGTPSDCDGSVSVGTEGWAFPLQTTKAVLKAGSSNGSGTLVWCSSSSSNCHHDYNAADIFAPTGTVEVAITDGTIVTVGDSTLTIKSDNPKSNTQYIFFYQHILGGSIKVKPGDRVKAGDAISKVGTIEDAFGTAPHLHIDAEPAPPATNRPICEGAACTGSQFHFINIQPILIATYKGLPE